jgi:prephenate dehydrogenase
MKELRQITVIGLGLLGGSLTRAVSQSFARVKTIGFTHRPATREKARQLAVADKVVDNISEAVSSADLVVLATPIHVFEQTFIQIADSLPVGCIVTDVGSTKILPHRWAEAHLPKTVHYVGSHPIAGSEQRGVEFARDDLFYQANCILTKTEDTNTAAVNTLKEFWSRLGCSVTVMTPVQHDEILANISHLPHIMAAALINITRPEQLRLAGKGFIDASRIASGPANIWADIFLTNADNTSKGIDTIITELRKIQKALKAGDQKQVEKLLETARNKRDTMIKYKMSKKELT